MKSQGGKQFAKGQYDRDTLLPAYLDELKTCGLPSSQWKSFNHTGLFPRRSAGYLYLGEDCRGHRHFDCEGFVAWVLVKAAGKDAGTWRKGVGWYQSGGGGRLQVYQASGQKYVSNDGIVISKLTFLMVTFSFASRTSLEASTLHSPASAELRYWRQAAKIGVSNGPTYSADLDATGAYCQLVENFATCQERGRLTTD